MFANSDSQLLIKFNSITRFTITHFEPDLNTNFIDYILHAIIFFKKFLHPEVLHREKLIHIDKLGNIKIMTVSEQFSKKFNKI